MTLEPDKLLLQGLEMTRRMLELVRAEEWEAVATLGADRLQLLRQWQNGADAQRAQLHLGILQEIQAIDREIESLSRRGREQTAERLRQIHQGRKADKAYRR